ncbi:DUF2225 domain-containing protein [Clostridium swellfunianum]|uniref:DUF2225 domain-containing protein n=1 Tax=Clostridium swellfunianum TaxID=1367462 RepID=UPI00203093B6|nr:DUF2225 domain-containing protein [Clostridium swellfunianum]MCM0646821.1 DUF2225 domain-containing protein [Clostridium swellfunianum]
MKENIFSGLEDLGFDNIDEVDIFNKKKEEEKENSQEKKEDDPRNLLYDASATCPVCGNKFQAKAVKSSAYRRQKNDSDLFVRYALINPYFYEVWICNACGYSAMKQDFDKIRDYQIELIQEKIAPKWQGRRYPEVYDVEIAIERYKLALLNSVVMESKTSRKALTCLRIAWMYRLQLDNKNEQLFLKQALEGFNDAYMNEDFPICGMDKYTVMYLIGELNRRTGAIDEANLWFSKLITTPNVPQKIKDLARDQRDVIKEETSKVETSEDSTEETKKSGFFSRFFK